MQNPITYFNFCTFKELVFFYLLISKASKKLWKLSCVLILAGQFCLLFFDRKKDDKIYQVIFLLLIRCNLSSRSCSNFRWSARLRKAFFSTRLPFDLENLSISPSMLFSFLWRSQSIFVFSIVVIFFFFKRISSSRDFFRFGPDLKSFYTVFLADLTFSEEQQVLFLPQSSHRRIRR